jgi:hypothetical protein
MSLVWFMVGTKIPGQLSRVNLVVSKLSQWLRTYLVDNVFAKSVFDLRVCLPNTS